MLAKKKKKDCNELMKIADKTRLEGIANKEEDLGIIQKEVDDPRASLI